MKKPTVLTLLPSLAIAGSLMPSVAMADVSIMYPEFITALVKPGIEAYEANTGIKVNAVKMPTVGYGQRVAVDLAAGTAPDIVVMDSFMVAELASANYLHPLDAQLRDWEQYKYYIKSLLSVASYDDKVYALPTDTDVRMLWYDKSVMKKAGIALPWLPQSWDDVLAASEKIKAQGVPYGFVLPAGTKRAEATTMQGFYMALLGADTPKNDRNRLRNRKEGKWIGDSPALRRTLELYRQVYVEKQLTPASINYETNVDAFVRTAINKDQVGILASGSWEFSCIWDCNGVHLPSIEERNAVMGWAPWPGMGRADTLKTTNISGGWTIGMAQSTKDKAEAFKLLTTIFDHDNFSKWTVAEHRMGVRTDITKSPEYTQDTYLAKATKLAENTTSRDTFPGYNVVTQLIQQATGNILDGMSVEDAITEYKESLMDEFGEDEVIVYQ